MAERLHRAQILLERGQHQALAEIAQREGRSISDIVRELIKEHLDQRRLAAEASAKRQLEALDHLRQHRTEMIARRQGKFLNIDVVEMIDDLRKERDERNLAGSGNYSS